MHTWRHAEIAKGGLVEYYFVEIDGHLFLVGLRNTTNGAVRQMAWGRIKAVSSDAVSVPWFKLPLVVKQKIVEIEEQYQIGTHNPKRPQIMQIK